VTTAPFELDLEALNQLPEPERAGSSSGSPRCRRCLTEPAVVVGAA
jgi:hypothetical protein